MPDDSTIRLRQRADTPSMRSPLDIYALPIEFRDDDRDVVVLVGHAGCPEVCASSASSYE